MVIYRAAKRQDIYINIYIDTTSHRRSTEVNNCFSILKNSEIIEHKKMVFNSFNVANNSDNFSAQMTNGRRVLLLTNKTFEGILLANVGKFLQKL